MTEFSLLYIWKNDKKLTHSIFEITDFYQGTVRYGKIFQAHSS